MMGETIFPNKKPNLNHNLFNGFSKFEFIKPKDKKIIEIIKDHNLKFPSLNNG